MEYKEGSLDDSMIDLHKYIYIKQSIRESVNLKEYTAQKTKVTKPPPKPLIIQDSPQTDSPQIDSPTSTTSTRSSYNPLLITPHAPSDVAMSLNTPRTPVHHPHQGQGQHEAVGHPEHEGLPEDPLEGLNTQTTPNTSPRIGLSENFTILEELHIVNIPIPDMQLLKQGINEFQIPESLLTDSMTSQAIAKLPQICHFQTES